MTSDRETLRVKTLFLKPSAVKESGMLGATGGYESCKFSLPQTGQDTGPTAAPAGPAKGEHQHGILRGLKFRAYIISWVINLLPPSLNASI